MENIRNFCIIAHIDHGKSTLADRFLEITGTISKRQMHAQYLDQLELEQERGITIKMAPVRMRWGPSSGFTQINEEINADNQKLLYEDITYKIRGALFKVYNTLGPGHKEGVYQNALFKEFTNAQLSFEREKKIDITYDGEKVGLYQPDFVIENKIIIELKALPFLGEPPKKQTRSYLKGSNYRLALLVNFGGNKLEIERIIHDNVRNKNIRVNPSQNPQESAGLEYILNLIDTPGHSDFSYEVSRALVAVESAILLVDGNQGIQAQTLANFHSAKTAGLKIIGAVNKIDIFKDKNDPILKKAARDLAELLGVKTEEIFLISGKTGEGVKVLLEGIIKLGPPPKTLIPDCDPPTGGPITNFSRALIFDSFYDNHKGVIASVRIFSAGKETDKNNSLAPLDLKNSNSQMQHGKDIQTKSKDLTGFKKDDDAYLIAVDEKSKIKEVGFFAPQLKPAEKIESGDIGYIATGVKDPKKIKIGDTIINADLRRYPTTQIKADKNIRENLSLNPRESASLALPGYKEPKPVVFVSFYPENSDDYDILNRGLQKLKLNDSALHIEPDHNEVLGRGFKLGFLGRLHYEITSERLKREFGAETVNTFPSVLYKIKTQKEWLEISSPEETPQEFLEIWEPMAQIEIILPSEYLNNVFPLQNKFRFSEITTDSFQDRIQLKALMPLSGLISDFDDQLKSATQGYASFSYEISDYKLADIVKIDILVAGKQIPGLSRFLPEETAERESREMIKRLKKLLPRQQFAQALQAVAGGKIIAREDIPAMRKDVTGYLYGGDRSRKMKLWQKQKRGKKRLKERSEGKISSQIFKELLKK